MNTKIIGINHRKSLPIFFAYFSTASILERLNITLERVNKEIPRMSQRWESANQSYNNLILNQISNPCVGSFPNSSVFVQQTLRQQTMRVIAGKERDNLATNVKKLETKKTNLQKQIDKLNVE